MIRHLTISPSNFDAILHGNQTFIIHENDKGYQKGDTVILKEYDPDVLPKTDGEEITANITYVTNYNQLPNVVVFGLSPFNSTILDAEQKLIHRQMTNNEVVNTLLSIAQKMEDEISALKEMLEIHGLPVTGSQMLLDEWEEIFKRVST